MNRLTRYMLKQQFIMMVFVTLGLLCVIWLSQSLRFIEMIVNRGLSVSVFLQLTSLLLPSFLAIILPISLFFVVVFTYNKLIQDRELIVMRSAGLSQWALAKPTLILALLTAAFGYFLTLFYLPYSYQQFKELQFSIRNDFSSVLLQEGSFTDLDGLTVYIREVGQDNELLGILVHDARDPNKQATMMAKNGALVRTENGPRIVLLDGNRQEVNTKDGTMSILYFDRYAVDIAHNAEDPALRYKEARERSVSNLLTTMPPDVLPNDIGSFRAEGHDRLLSPLYSIGFASIALAVLVSSSFSRRGQTGRLLFAIAIMIVFQVISITMKNLAAKNPDLVPLMYLNALLPIAGGLYWTFRGPQIRAKAGSRDEVPV
ncbi:LPS export ABC transporter permease LptF [Thalassospira permensis]|uniref:Permease n=1 Tax=Thalassospira permensis NBRC 106175 TaxID=1353532 RepID=A0ABR4TPA2_9PROT|nr:LPS export ABC transporter permease LptF [Thalassospira permensis]KEO56855.1 permease [Thalassospira permensis NBRC 106175]